MSILLRKKDFFKLKSPSFALKLIWNRPNIVFIVWLLTYLPGLEWFWSRAWKSANYLTFRGLILGWNLVLLNKGAYIRGIKVQGRFYLGFYCIFTFGKCTIFNVGNGNPLKPLITSDHIYSVHLTIPFAICRMYFNKMNPTTNLWVKHFRGFKQML